jgi:hypothetical protein
MIVSIAHGMLLVRKSDSRRIEKIWLPDGHGFKAVHHLEHRRVTGMHELTCGALTFSGAAKAKGSDPHMRLMSSRGRPGRTLSVESPAIAGFFLSAGCKFAND